MNDGKWRWVSASVRGTSHIGSDTECQDNHLCEQLDIEDGPVLLGLVSDGAGSAKKSAEGSKIICEVFRDELQQYFTDRGTIGQITERLVAHWIEQFRNEIILRAGAQSLSESEFACTLLGAVVGPTSTVCFQVGDGAIVYATEENSEYSLVFWPERGEYENTTYFASQADVLNHLQFVLLEHKIKEIAIFSDGLQRLALSYENRSAYQPFFNGFFPTVKNKPIEELPLLNEQLALYLNSRPVNERTDDDKTIIVAART